LTTDEYDKRLVAVRRIALGGGISVCPASAARKAGRGNDRVWKAWKAKKPASHGLDDWIYVFSCPLNSNHRHGKGLVTDVSGPQRNASRFTHPWAYLALALQNRPETWFTAKRDGDGFSLSDLAIGHPLEKLRKALWRHSRIEEVLFVLVVGYLLFHHSSPLPGGKEILLD
jgi:hypothetical protein